jgi:hypothetical protein
MATELISFNTEDDRRRAGYVVMPEPLSVSAIHPRECPYCGKELCNCRKESDEYPINGVD